MNKCIKLLNLILIISLLFINSFSVMAAENEELGSWDTKASNHIGRYNFGLGVLNNKIYIVGGYASFEEPNITSLEEYDPITDTWTLKANMPTGRSRLGVAVANGKLYAIGGFANMQGAAKSVLVEEYDPITDTWVKKADMPTGRKDVKVITVDGKIYAIGGQDLVGNKLKTVEVYNPITNTWISKAEMLTARTGFSLSELNGKIYAIGGEYNPNRGVVEEYDPVNDTWTKKADMPTERGCSGAVSLNGKIYVIGGYYGGIYYQTAEEYNPVTDTWTTIADMPTGRYGLGVVALNNNIYAIDGLYRKDGGNNIYTNTVEVFTPGETSQKPNAPMNLTATPATTNIVLNWDIVDNIDSYTILRSTSSDSINTVIASNVTDTTYIDNDLEPGVTYHYVVRAVKDGVESTDSNVASAMIEKNNNRALLLIKLLDENDKEYDLSISDVDTFMNWYFERGEGQGPAYYVFNKSFNVGPYLSRKDYITYNKIICIEVNEYEQ